MARKKTKAKKTVAAPAKGGNSNVMGALAYLLGLLSGVIIYLLKRDDAFVRFHAVQSIVWFVLLWMLTLVFAFLGPIGVILIVNLVSFISWLWLMFKAVSGEKYMIPKVGEFAAQHA